MKPATERILLSICLAFALAAWRPSPSWAQQDEYDRWLMNQAQGISNASVLERTRGASGGRIRVRRTERLMQEYNDQIEANRTGKRFSIPELITTPKGEMIVAQVGPRIMVAGELRNRIAMRLKGLPTIRHPNPKRESELRTEQMLKLAGELIGEWTEATVLATVAERSGTEVSAAEIDKALNDLSGGTGSGRGNTAERVQLLGVPERELRGELRDALLTEKYVMGLIRTHNTEQDYRRIYRLSPQAFRIPPRVHGYHLFAPLDPKISNKDRKKLRKKLRSLHRMLSEEAPDFEAIVAAVAGSNIFAVDMGWLSGDGEQPPQIYSALFNYAEGSVSPIFEEGNAVHIVRVIEREGGSDAGFEASIPQIENYLFAKTRNMVFEANRPAFKVQTNIGGLVRWREVGEEEYRQYLRVVRGPAPGSRRARSAPKAVPSSRPKEAAEPQGPVIDLGILGKKPDLP